MSPTIFGASARFNAPWKVTNGSWALSLRAEREKEPNLDPAASREAKLPSPNTSPRIIFVKAKPSRRRCRAHHFAKAKELFKGTPEQPPKAEEPNGDSPAPDNEPEDLKHTLLFWKEYNSMAKREKGQPAWHEEPTSFVLPHFPVSNVTWDTEAARRRKALQQRANASEAAAALHLEVQLQCKERLRLMIRTGQVEKVKKEMKASLRLTAESRQSGEAEEVAKFGPTKEEALSLKQQGDTQDALKMMSRHRNELLKARRTLEQALDRLKLFIVLHILHGPRQYNAGSFCHSWTWSSEDVCMIL
ncbi:unnamed protein product [Durusdinium trenchii]|uniref:RAB6-interacting golgin n=1 Tax=Durusdinium trenchii TaxID=1381693 RepID=A0ABP0N4H9_9DINO